VERYHTKEKKLEMVVKLAGLEMPRAFIDKPCYRIAAVWCEAWEC